MSPSYALSLCLACGPGIAACRGSKPCKRAFVTYYSKKSYEKAKELYFKKREPKRDAWPIVNKWLD